MYEDRKFQNLLAQPTTTCQYAYRETGASYGRGPNSVAQEERQGVPQTLVHHTASVCILQCLESRHHRPLLQQELPFVGNTGEVKEASQRGHLALGHSCTIAQVY